MSGRFHSTKTPSRQRDILRRDAFGFIKRNDRAAESIHEAIYFSPWGKGHHKVTDPYSGEVFVVADGLGGATVMPGTPVTLASYGDQHGRVLIARPPSGMGGSSVSRTTERPSIGPSGAPPPPGDDPSDVTYGAMGFCWNSSNARAIVARLRQSASEGTNILQFVKVDRAYIPYLEVGSFTAFASIALTDAEASALRVYAMQSGPSSSCYIFYYIGEAGSVADTATMHLAKISNAGEVESSVTYDFPDVATLGLIGTAFFGGSLYAIEFIEGPTEVTGGNPFENDQRITKRHQNTLEVESEYDVPDPSSYDGWTLAGSAVMSIMEVSGLLRAYYEYQRAGVGDYKMFYQDYTSSLTPSGAHTAFASNPTHAWGVLNRAQAGGSLGAVFVDGTDLFGATVAGGSLSTILSSYNNDGETTFYGIASINDDEVLVMGTGNTFTLSILTSAGQQLP